MNCRTNSVKSWAIAPSEETVLDGHLALTGWLAHKTNFGCNLVVLWLSSISQFFQKSLWAQETENCQNNQIKSQVSCHHIPYFFFLFPFPLLKPIWQEGNIWSQSSTTGTPKHLWKLRFCSVVQMFGFYSRNQDIWGSLIELIPYPLKIVYKITFVFLI